ncbi:type II toxin-antitoxin system RelE/ParE family toxin [Candidatus Bipolaricaulota bacterium]|nr:type II toxin-antitoxin system RelE/ParE family toxin [Candidatus Bipolaricaulota bacterium]
MPSYQVFLTPQAQLMLHFITDRRIRNMIARRIDELTEEPAKKGKALVAELTGFRSLRIARYRVLYKVEKKRVIIVAVGIRREGDTKDIYARAKKLLRLKLIEFPTDR